MSKLAFALISLLGVSVVACGEQSPTSSSSSAARSSAAPGGSAKASSSPVASAAPAADKKSPKERLLGVWQFTDDTLDKMLQELPPDVKEEDRKKIREDMKKGTYEWAADGKAFETDHEGKKTERSWEVVKEDGDKIVIKDKRGESVDELTITFESDDKISVLMPDKSKDKKEPLTAFMTRKKP